MPPNGHTDRRAFEPRCLLGAGRGMDTVDPLGRGAGHGVVNLGNRAPMCGGPTSTTVAIHGRGFATPGDACGGTPAATGIADRVRLARGLGVRFHHDDTRWAGSHSMVNDGRSSTLRVPSRALCPLRHSAEDWLSVARAVRGGGGRRGRDAASNSWSPTRRSSRATRAL